MLKGALSLALLTSTAVLAQAPGAAVRITREGAQAPTPAPAENFTGTARVEMRFKGDVPARIGGGLVSFEPGARTHWHTHPLGQTLIVAQGVGLVQHWGGPVQEMRPGDVVWIPAGTKHWHGASPTSAMSHWALSEQLDGNSVTWLEPVTDAQYKSQTP